MSKSVKHRDQPIASQAVAHPEIGPDSSKAIDTGRVLYIMNPAAFGGAKSQRWKRFQELWPHPIPADDVLVTEHPGHARELAACAEGYDILTAVGGDGTVGDVLTGIMEHPEHRPLLAIVPAGTGNDTARNVGIHDVEDAVVALDRGRARAWDLMRVDCRVNGQPAHRYAFLAVTAGFTANVAIKPWMKRILGPTGGYYLSTILEMIAYEPPRLAVRWRDGVWTGRAWSVIIGNVERTSGGSMCLAPGAHADDGELNVSIIPFRPKLMSALTLLPKVPTGKHVDDPSVAYFPVTRIEVDSDPTSLLDLDGDVYGTTPVTVTVCPRALEVLSPPPK